MLHNHPTQSTVPPHHPPPSLEFQTLVQLSFPSSPSSYDANCAPVPPLDAVLSSVQSWRIYFYLLSVELSMFCENESDNGCRILLEEVHTTPLMVA
ncbi:hypothetical protein QVD17_16073 [Tagetes erecta]|uniref:Uncharacterized protein n=1 Tax=Tagetes erecta TaxID=13708 RepID=A0AAD8KX59_TARER|nr:hypothetical protein QVD17_16073 [Tagetes erecta]